MLDTDVCWGQSCSTFLSVSQGQSLFETLKPLWGLTHSDNPVLGPSGSWVLPHQLSSAETSVSLREAWELAKRGKNVLWEYSFHVFLLILGILWVTPTPKPMDSWQWIMIRGLQVPIFVVNFNFFTVTALWAVQQSFWRQSSGSETDRFFSTVYQDMALPSSTSPLLVDLVWPWSAPALSHNTRKKVTYYFGLVIKSTLKAIIYNDNYRETFSNLQLSFMWSRWPVFRDSGVL